MASCLLLGPRYQEAAHNRTPPQLALLLPQLVLVLAAALALSFALSSLTLRRGGAAEGSSSLSSLSGGRAEARAGTEAAGAEAAVGALSRVATRLLMLHFLAEGVRNVWMAVAGEAGFQLDDASVVITNDVMAPPLPVMTPHGEEEAGVLGRAYATALVMLAQARSHSAQPRGATRRTRASSLHSPCRLRPCVAACAACAPDDVDAACAARAGLWQPNPDWP